jgi:hypothetical protein
MKKKEPNTCLYYQLQWRGSFKEVWILGSEFSKIRKSHFNVSQTSEAISACNIIVPYYITA